MTPLELSASKICQSRYAMVFGFESCKYQDVFAELSVSSAFKYVFDYHIGYKGHDQAFELTPHISQMQTDKSTASTCKAALVNIVLENYKRKKLGKELIPILFAIDCENNTRSVTPEVVATKEEEQNKKITFKELRRAYKLCEEFADPEIRAIGQETFKFVKVNDDLSLSSIDAPWQKKGWKKHWKKRKLSPKKPARKKLDWRSQLGSMKIKFHDKDTTRSPTTPLSTTSSDSPTSHSPRQEEHVLICSRPPLAERPSPLAKLFATVL